MAALNAVLGEMSMFVSGCQVGELFGVLGLNF